MKHGFLGAFDQYQLTLSTHLYIFVLIEDMDKHFNQMKLLMVYDCHVATPIALKTFITLIWYYQLSLKYPEYVLEIPWRWGMRDGEMP